LRINNSIRWLSLRENSIEPGGGYILVSYLKETNKLERADLRGIKFTREEVLSLAHHSLEVKNLQEISISVIPSMSNLIQLSSGFTKIKVEV